MNADDTERKPWWKRIIDRWPWIAAGVIVIALFGWGLERAGYQLALWPAWGLFGKQLWEWLELLIVPVVLAVGAYLFNRREQITDREIAKEERENDRKIAREREEERALETYLGRMGDLLEKGLREKPYVPEDTWMDEKAQKEAARKRETNEVLADIARTFTLTILQRLSGERKRVVVQFLFEADLIGKRVTEDDQTVRLERVVSLEGANLRRANLERAYLERANLKRAYLERANLRGAYLQGANLAGTNLDGANLNGANLSGANLEDANLWEAYLSNANLDGASLDGANLQAAKLERAILNGATMPDGTEYSPSIDLSKFTDPP